MEEAKDAVITLEEDDPALVKALLLFLYTMGYFPEADIMVFHAQMYAIADKYGLPDLKNSAKEAFQRLILKECDNASLSETASLVYSLTPEGDRGLRDIFVDYLWASRKTLFPR